MSFPISIDHGTTVGDNTIQPTGIVKSKQATANSRWVLIDVMVRNQNEEKVATGEAMVEFSARLISPGAPSPRLR